MSLAETLSRQPYRRLKSAPRRNTGPIRSRAEPLSVEALESLLGRGSRRHGIAVQQRKSISMKIDPDPFEQGERAAPKNIPAEANPYQDGSDEHALWAAGHEKAAGEMEARQSEGS